jgi:hypothetical protein
MPEAMDCPDGAAAGDISPGAAMRLVAGRLMAQGFEVRGPEWAEGRRMQVINLREATCEVTVEDSGLTIWEYLRPASKGADLDRLTALVTHLLTEGHAYPPRHGSAGRTVRAGLQSAVGRDLEANGLMVDLEVYADHHSFEVASEIVVTSPAHPERGRVHITDDPGLTWECGFQEHPVDPAATADTITAVLIRDIADGYICLGEPALACKGQAAH